MPDRAPLLAAAAGIALLIPHAVRPVLVWNATPSAPIGLYRITAPLALRAGDLVIARPPAEAARLAATRGYLPRGVPLVKLIVALPGEPVCARGAIVRAPRGMVVRRVSRDRRGRSLPWWRGCGALSASSYLLLMPHVPDSFDGRYFGPVSGALILGKAHPLWLL